MVNYSAKDINKAAAAAKIDTAGIEAKNAEIEALKLQLEEAKKATPAKEDVGIGEMPNRFPVEGYAKELMDGMKQYVQDQISAALPERGQPIRSREPARDTRAVARRGAVMAHDREGNPIYRRRDSVSDPFSIPMDLRDPDWDTQWVRVSVHGWEDVDNQVGMQENGWRPISANRPGWEGRFMPPGYKGAIQKSGLMLMERPMTLSQEAHDEEKRLVRAQTETQRQQFGMALPSGFDGNTAAARAASGIRVGKPEATPASLRPKHQVEGIEIHD
jgi:hypothetical protein